MIDVRMVRVLHSQIADKMNVFSGFGKVLKSQAKGVARSKTFEEFDWYCAHFIGILVAQRRG